MDDAGSICQQIMCIAYEQHTDVGEIDGAVMSSHVDHTRGEVSLVNRGIFLEYIKVDEELAAKEMMKYWNM